MAASGGLAAEPPAQEVLEWLKKLPLAPEYHPSLAEFQDPIAYIFKIEKEASKYGICKIVPPVLAASKKAAIANLNRSLAARAGATGSNSQPTFTTRQQQIGFCPRKPRPVRRPVWQSGEYYTFQEFEAKAKAFERSYLKKCPKKVTFSPLEMETLYWKATVDKPFSVEYANDMPGSAFSPKKSSGKQGALGEGVTVGETEWNMRGVSRAKGSLLRFMKEEIPGVTSPMLYIAMMFSWFAWHVEDHDLHSLNYLHMGAGKTWYGVPREAAVAFEEVVRVLGYGEEINPLVTFSVLGEKTTVMSPEVFISAGVPCCRLVQNAGEFVVTFPRAYHSGFSHGFNCGEAANIATPEWLMVAKDAAIRRASINYPPMVSHFQLLYDLALELCTRIPVSISTKPRSSRLKDKQKGEGETLVKELFVKNVIQNNDLLDTLGKGASVVLLPQSSSDISVCSNLRVGSQLRLKPSLGLCSYKGLMKSLESSISDDIARDVDHRSDQVKNLVSMKGKLASLYESNRFSSLNENGNIQAMKEESLRGSNTHGDKLSDQRLFSCVTCGILSFDCVAIVQPTEATARYLLSADCSFLNDWIIGSGVAGDGLAISANANTSELKSPTRLVEKNVTDGLYDVPVQSINCQIQMVNQNIEVPSDSETQKHASALGLLSLNYGSSSDAEEDQVKPDVSHGDNQINMANCSESVYQGQSSPFSSFKKEFNVASDGFAASVSRLDCGDEVALQAIDWHAAHRMDKLKDRSDQTLDSEILACRESNVFQSTFRDPKAVSPMATNCSSAFCETEKQKLSRAIVPREHADASLAQRSDEDSLRMHVFCVEHAVEVEQQLRQIGGVHILLLCHPEYPRVEAEAKLVSEELGVDYLWKDISFRDATKDDEEMIQTALDNEDAIPGNRDWAVKLGINLFYSANLSRSPLYSKQMPYNSVIYNAFGRTSPAGWLAKLNVYGRRSGKQKKVVVGKWCGKIWMSSQVHPFLAKWDSEEHDQEQEQERSIHNLGIPPDEKLERKQQSINRTATTSFSKSGRKRKLRSENMSVKKVKYLETEDAASDDSVEDNPPKPHLKIHRLKGTRNIQKEISYDSLEENSYGHCGKICRTKLAKAVERDDAISDDSLDQRIHKRKQAKHMKGKLALVESNSQKQIAKEYGRKHFKWVEVEGAFSDDSLEDNSDRWNGRARRSAQTKFFETEDVVSGGSVGVCSPWEPGRICRNKQEKYVEKEDEVSDDSLENRSRWQTSKNFRGNHSKYTERKNVISYDSMGGSSYQQLTRFPKAKQARFMEREEVDSDDSLGNNIYKQQRRILSSKQAKFIEREHEVYDDSVEDNSQSLQARVFRSKSANFIEREDAASDEMMADDTHQRPRRVCRSKKMKFDGSQDSLPDDLHEANSRRRLRKTPRGKQAKSIEEEDPAPDDLLGDDSNQRSLRILRNKQNKFVTLHQMKQETFGHVKQRTPLTTKKENQFVKQEKQMKQETPRLRSKRNEQNSRQSDSHVEGELEGGPSTRLRQRPSKSAKETETKLQADQRTNKKKGKSSLATKAPAGRKNVKRKEEEAEYQCDIEGCTMSFGSKQELAVHKRNICPVKGCGKKFFSHKYLVQHHRVHLDDRPLKCPWKGCKMTFKWAWARTEHIRVHTGARPYVCVEEGCGQTFRFVSDFSRHKRKTGHSTKKGRG